jgi:hypothetical protein
VSLFEQSEDEVISPLNRAKYLSLRHISEPEDNSLRLVVEEAIADRTETVSTPAPTSPFAELRKGASPINQSRGAEPSNSSGAATSHISSPKRAWVRGVAMRTRFTPATCFGCTPNPIFSTTFPATRAATLNQSCITS